MLLQRKVRELEPSLALDFDESKIQWKPFLQNHAYGIKKYILQEETYLPSAGFQDARKMMSNPYTASYVTPMKHNVFEKKVASFEETKKIVFASKWVQNEIDKIVKDKLAKLDKSQMVANKSLAPTKKSRAKSQSPPKRMGSSIQEENIRREVEDVSTKMLQRIFSNYANHNVDKLMFGLQRFFKNSYKKVIVNEMQIKKLKSLFR